MPNSKSLMLEKNLIKPALSSFNYAVFPQKGQNENGIYGADDKDFA
jgi:hypothetical protein